jgi:hypothetical protein
MLSAILYSGKTPALKKNVRTFQVEFEASGAKIFQKNFIFISNG